MIIFGLKNNALPICVSVYFYRRFLEHINCIPAAPIFEPDLSLNGKKKCFFKVLWKDLSNLIFNLYCFEKKVLVNLLLNIANQIFCHESYKVNLQPLIYIYF